MYLMAQVPREEMASEDPFGGQGVFLDAPGIPGEVILARLFELLGKTVPAVAWGDLGVWVAPGSCDIDSDSIHALWDGGKAREC